jgi:hypothetical protein
MGRRMGQGQILSADELAERLAIPCFYILTGRANAAFPYTSVPGPSPFVKVVQTRPTLNSGDAQMFGVTVHWRQWHTIIAPILEEYRMSNYIGNLGGEATPLNGGTPTTPVGRGQGIYSGFHEEFIEVLRDTIRLRAVQQGYGSPDQVPLPEGSC